MDTTSGESISLSLRMARAMTLARAGQLREAQKLVADERTIPEDMLALHSLAALVTSEGDYLRALKLWELVLQRDPAHAEAKRMISAIEVWLMRPTWFRYLPHLGIVAGLAVLGLVFLLATAGPSTRSVPTAPRATADTPVSPASQVREQTGSSGTPSGNSYVPPAPTTVPPIKFSVPAPVRSTHSRRTGNR